MATWDYNLTLNGYSYIFTVTSPTPVGTATVTATSISGTVDGQQIIGFSGYDGADQFLSTGGGIFFDGIDGNGIGFTYINSSNETIYVDVFSSNGQLRISTGNSPTSYSYNNGVATINSYSEVACFATGTRIQTPAGPVAVEDLAVGDVLLTAEGRAAPVIWIGHRKVNCAAHPRPNDVMPVRVRRGAFAEGVPSRDLWLSPDHAIHAETCLIPVKHLLNGATIVQEQADSITYWHVELNSTGMM